MKNVIPAPDWMLKGRLSQPHMTSAEVQEQIRQSRAQQARSAQPSKPSLPTPERAASSQKAPDEDLDKITAFEIEKILTAFEKNKEACYKEVLERLPKPGAKLRYRGTHKFWFTDIVSNAERELKIGTTYTLRTIELFSSWTSITLEETGDIEFSLGFFDWREHICCSAPF